ncbi:unnamed protein product, partial [marine sediment metagenome]
SAIDAANPGDTVFVYDGYYFEEIITNKTVILKGESNQNTIVWGGFNVSANSTTIEGFKIVYGMEWDPDNSGPNGIYKIGIYAKSSLNLFLNNSISNMLGGNGENRTGTWSRGGDGGAGCGIYLFNSEMNEIKKNNFSEITGGKGGLGDGGPTYGGDGGIGCAIYLHDSKSNIIINNTMFDLNGGKGGRGNGWLSNNLMGLGGIGCGIFLYQSDDNVMENTSIETVLGGNGEVGWNNNGGIGGTGSGFYIKDPFNNLLNLNYIYD